MNLRWHLNKWLVKTAFVLLRLSGWYTGYWNHWRTFFDDAQSKGLHIMPVHYYSPIPDTRNLPDSLWLTPRTPVGFDLNIDKALHLLDRFAPCMRSGGSIPIVFSRQYRLLNLRPWTPVLSGYAAVCRFES